MRFRRYLFEKRSHPELNPKLYRSDMLEPYKDDPNIFISFTNINKIGINPKSGYNTPNGIYTYPLKEMWHAVEYMNIPFAGERPFIQVVKITTNKILDVSKYTQKDFDRDIDKLINKFKKSIIDKFFKNTDISFLNNEQIKAKMIEKSDKNSYKSKNELASKIWYLTMIVAGNANKWNSILRKTLGYDVVIDRKGLGVIHSSERIQTVFLTKSAFKHIKTIENKRRLITMVDDEIYKYTPGEKRGWIIKNTKIEIDKPDKKSLDILVYVESNKTMNIIGDDICKFKFRNENKEMGKLTDFTLKNLEEKSIDYDSIWWLTAYIFRGELISTKFIVDAIKIAKKQTKMKYLGYSAHYSQLHPIIIKTLKKKSKGFNTVSFSGSLITIYNF